MARITRQLRSKGKPRRMQTANSKKIRKPSKPKPKTQPKEKPARITQAIFGRDADRYTRETLKHILNIFHQKVPPRQRREVLLQRAIDLEAKLRYNEALTITQLLQRDQAITRSAINEGSKQLIDPISSPDGVDPATQCGICLETVTPDQTYQGDLGRGCKHQPLICIDCMGSWVKSQIANEGWRKISCPFCLELLPADVIRTHVPAESLESFEAFEKTRDIRDHEKFRWCLRPGCRSGVIHEWGDRRPKITCKSCNFETCYTCQLAWDGVSGHGGGVCLHEQLEKLDNDQASELFIKQSSKLCPRCQVSTMLDMNDVHCGQVKCICSQIWHWPSAGSQT